MRFIESAAVVSTLLALASTAVALLHTSNQLDARGFSESGKETAQIDVGAISSSKTQNADKGSPETKVSVAQKESKGPESEEDYKRFLEESSNAKNRVSKERKRARKGRKRMQNIGRD